MVLFSDAQFLGRRWLRGRIFRNLARSTLLVTLLASSGCSIRKIAINTLGDALAKGASSWASEEDPELVREAIPFGLKTVEGLLAESPRHRGLLLAAASGFTQYAYAFLQAEADFIEGENLQKATALRARARKLYLRALDYGLRGLEAAHKNFRSRLRVERERAADETGREDVPLLYWTAAAWGAAISISKEDAELTADLSLAEALMRQALRLDEGFGRGAIHDFFIAYEGGRPAAAGGSAEKARQHLDRALALSDGQRAAPLVSFAETVCVAAQNRKEFQELLSRALAVDADRLPDQRLANLLAQRRARWLLERVDELFLE